MREILFKAKRLSDGAWVEGYLYRLHDSLNPFIMFRNRHGEAYEVDPSTVCQYTGLTDRNGKKIFVGDIVRCSRGCPHEVVWVQEHGGTFIGGMPAVYLSGLTPGYAWTGAEEIIGSIHDGEGGQNGRNL